MKKLSLLAFCILAVFAAGCGEKEAPPLTTDALEPNAVTAETNGQASGAVPARPQVNPNAKYSPKR